MAKQTENISLRLPAWTVSRLRQMAERSDQSLTAVIAEFLPDEQIQEVVQDLAELRRESFGSVLRSLLAQGLRQEMLSAGIDYDSRQEFEFKLYAHGGSRMIFELFDQWRDAFCQQIGLIRNGKDRNEYVFVEVEGGDGLAIVPAGWTARRGGVTGIIRTDPSGQSDDWFREEKG